MASLYRRALVASILALFAGAFGNSAYAQEALAATPPTAESQVPARSGWIASLALGVGNIGVSGESNGGGSLQLEAGGFVRPNLAIIGDASAVNSSDEAYYVKQRSLLVGVRYWLSESFWTKAAVGFATFESGLGDVSLGRFNGGGLLFAGGWEFYNHDAYHFDVRFQLGVQGYRDARDNTATTGLMLGFSYF